MRRGGAAVRKTKAETKRSWNVRRARSFGAGAVGLAVALLACPIDAIAIPVSVTVTEGSSVLTHFEAPPLGSLEGEFSVTEQRMEYQAFYCPGTPYVICANEVTLDSLYLEGGFDHLPDSPAVHVDWQLEVIGPFSSGVRQIGPDGLFWDLPDVQWRASGKMTCVGSELICGFVGVPLGPDGVDFDHILTGDWQLYSAPIGEQEIPYNPDPLAGPCFISGADCFPIETGFAMTLANPLGEIIPGLSMDLLLEIPEPGPALTTGLALLVLGLRSQSTKRR